MLMSFFNEVPKYSHIYSSPVNIFEFFFITQNTVFQGCFKQVFLRSAKFFHWITQQRNVLIFTQRMRKSAQLFSQHTEY